MKRQISYKSIGIYILFTAAAIFSQPQSPTHVISKPIKQFAPIDTAALSKKETAPADDSINKKHNPINSIPIADSIKIPILDFKNTDIRDVLRGLGMQYSLNIFCEPDVTGSITLYLTNVSVRQAIDFIVKRNGFAYTVENGIIKVSRYTAPPPPPPPPPVQKFHFSDGKLDIDIKKCSVQDLARMFSDSAGVNVLLDGKIDKELTARLVNITPENAVKSLFESNGLQVSLQDGIYYISNQFTGDKANSKSSQRNRLSISIKNQQVSLEVDNASLDQVVRTIAIQSGINIVIYDKLTGDISAKLANVVIDDAVRFLLQNTKFTFWKEKGIYFIGSREMNQQKTTAIIPLKHIMAEAKQIEKMLPPSIKSGATVNYDSEHNSVIIIGSFDIVAQAEEFFDKIDKPIPQVLIEALVVDFNVNKIQDFGLSLFTQGPGDSSGNWLSERFLPQIDVKPGKNKTERILKDVLKSIGLDRAHQIIDLPDNFRASIHALESADIVKVHSTPQIATINGNPASITIGETRYYKLQKETKSSSDNTTNIIGTDERFEVIKFNTDLKVTPWVMEDGYVMVKIRPEFNIPRTGGDGTTPPDVDTRVIESMVRLRDGQTIVLGGQRQTEDVVNRRGVPFLSSIPVLGWLFSSRTVSKNETQMMIFLTPHVYYSDDNAVSPDDFFGKEVNKILDKYGFDKKESPKEKTMKTDNDSTEQAPSFSGPNHKEKRRINWPWLKKKEPESSDSLSTDSTAISTDTASVAKPLPARQSWRMRRRNKNIQPMPQDTVTTPTSTEEVD